MRFGGLRTPSEHHALTWDDINWAQNRILIRSSKTEHHEGREDRFVPIFPELRPYLEQAWQPAATGQVSVLRRYHRKENLGTQLERIIRRFGLTTWPKLF